MKKTITAMIFSVVALYFSQNASAQEAVIGTSEQFQSTMTCFGISVDSQVPTAIIASTQTLYRSISIQNRDTTANYYCSPNVNVSSQTGTTFSTRTGILIAPGQTAGIVIAPAQQQYCLNDSANKRALGTACLGR